MRRVIVCIVVAALCCLSVVPVARAASTFTADLAVYRARANTTSEAAHGLVLYVAGERRFVRTIAGTSAQFRAVLRTYRVTLDQTDDAARRIVRDQRTSDALLADITELNGGGHTDAAWILLKRGLAGQERFLVTISRARALMAKCKNLHTRLVQAGT
ncbi:MAG: hypothetical protein ACYDHF_08475 [Candidatus Cryosericum sp.]